MSHYNLVIFPFEIYNGISVITLENICIKKSSVSILTSLHWTIQMPPQESNKASTELMKVEAKRKLSFEKRFGSYSADYLPLFISQKLGMSFFLSKLANSLSVEFTNKLMRLFVFWEYHNFNTIEPGTVRYYMSFSSRG